MFLSKNKNTRGRYYVYFIDENRKRRPVTTGTSFKNEALAFLIEFANKVKENNSSIPSSRPLKSISELEKNVMNYVSNNLRKGTVSIYKNTFKTFMKIIEEKLLNGITIKEIEYYKSCWIKEVTPSTCNIDLNTLKSIFNIGIKFGWCLHNPVKGISKLRIPQKEKLSINNEELSKLLDVTKENIVMLNIILFGLNTGCRLGELLNLQWKDIDLSERIIHIRNKENFKTKTGKVRQMPINNKLNEIIKQMMVGNDNIIKLYDLDGYIFSKLNNTMFSRNSISHKFKYYIRKARLSEKYHFHCLRHTFITNCIKKGINANYVQALAGHSDLKTTMEYIHIGIEDLKRAILVID
jgi:integrase/recombinase XerD